MKTRTVNETIVARLVQTTKWSEETAGIGVRAGFRCEYCDLDLLASADNYKQWQTDHIIPLTADGTESIDNKAAACRTCNFCYKVGWDPRNYAGRDATRNQLIDACKRYIAERRQKTADEIVSYRKIVEEAE